MWPLRHCSFQWYIAIFLPLTPTMSYQSSHKHHRKGFFFFFWSSGLCCVPNLEVGSAQPVLYCQQDITLSLLVVGKFASLWKAEHWKSTLECSLDWKENVSVATWEQTHRLFTEWTETEAQMFWPHSKNAGLNGEDCHPGKSWRQSERTMEVEAVHTVTWGNWC